MRALGVIVAHPSRDQIAGMGEIAEQCFVEKLIPHPAVEAFDKPILHRLTRRDIVPFDLVLDAPLQDRVRGQLRPVIADDHPEPRRVFRRLIKVSYAALASFSRAA